MVSIIVPILNEEKEIVRLQKNLKNLKGDYEVIFSDGGSMDRTLELICPEFHVVQGKKGRGCQMNRAVEAASGDILFFIHSDVGLESDVLLKIPEVVKNGEAVGYLKIRFDSGHILMKICGFMSSLRVRIRKIVFADQGLIIHRELFQKMGKMPEIPLMEDYEFSIRMKKRRVPVVRMDSPILVSARRFEQKGMLRTMWQMQKYQVKYILGSNVEKLAREYENIR